MCSIVRREKVALHLVSLTRELGRKQFSIYILVTLGEVMEQTLALFSTLTIQKYNWFV